MALMYALDVIAMERWGQPPDLVISGPNKGQNVGPLILSSGTVSNAQFAGSRGLPAIALNTGMNTRGEDVGNPVSIDVARRSLELLTAIERGAGTGMLLPRELALNVNFPDESFGAEWRLSRIGTYNAYNLSFAASTADSASSDMQAMARARGAPLPDLPGLVIRINPMQPDTQQMRDESVVHRTHISISRMQTGYDSTVNDMQFLRWQLSFSLDEDAE